MVEILWNSGGSKHFPNVTGFVEKQTQNPRVNVRYPPEGDSGTQHSSEG